MYCKYLHEHVSESDCNECDNIECEYTLDFDKKKNQMLNSDMAKMISEKLTTFSGLDKERAGEMVSAFCEQILTFANKNILEMTKKALEIQAWKFIETLTADWLQKQFDEALQKEIPILNGDMDKISETTIQNIVLEKYTSFFNSQGRNNSSSLENAMDNVISKKVKESINELREETIDKFNKEMMKKMMAGMAGAIADDKRLLAVLE